MLLVFPKSSKQGSQGSKNIREGKRYRSHSYFYFIVYIQTCRIGNEVERWRLLFGKICSNNGVGVGSLLFVKSKSVFPVTCSVSPIHLLRSMWIIGHSIE